MDGRPQEPHPHVHILPRLYDTWPWRAASPWSRGERGEAAESSLGERYRSALVAARPMSLAISLLIVKSIQYCPAASW